MNLLELCCKCGDLHWRTLQENENVRCGNKVSFFCLGCGKLQSMEIIRIGYVNDPDLRKIFKVTYNCMGQY